MYIKIKNGEKEEGGRHLLCDHRCEEFSLKNNFHLLECVRVPGPRSGVEKTPHQNGNEKQRCFSLYEFIHEELYILAPGH